MYNSKIEAVSAADYTVRGKIILGYTRNIENGICIERVSSDKRFAYKYL